VINLAIIWRAVINLAIIWRVVINLAIIWRVLITVNIPCVMSKCFYETISDTHNKLSDTKVRMPQQNILSMATFVCKYSLSKYHFDLHVL